MLFGRDGQSAARYPIELPSVISSVSWWCYVVLLADGGGQLNQAQPPPCEHGWIPDCDQTQPQRPTDAIWSQGNSVTEAIYSRSDQDYDSEDAAADKRGCFHILLCELSEPNQR